MYSTLYVLIKQLFSSDIFCVCMCVYLKGEKEKEKERVYVT